MNIGAPGGGTIAADTDTTGATGGAENLFVAADDVCPPAAAVIVFARQIASIVPGSAVGSEVSQRPTGSHQKRFHVALKGREPREVVEAESAGAPALRDDQLIALIRLFPGYGQDILPSSER
jgi:hypothetical protein